MNIDQSCQERVATSAMLKCCYRATADMTVAVQWSHSLPAGDLTSGPPVSQAGPPVTSPSYLATVSQWLGQAITDY